MKRQFLFISIFAYFLFFVPTVTEAQMVSVESEYRALLFELIEVLQSQVLLLQSELVEQQDSILLIGIEKEERRQDTGSSIKNGFVSVNDSVDVIKTYSIDKSDDVGRINNSVHRKYFQRLFDLFPTEFDSKIKELVIYKGEDPEYDSFVETLPPNHDYWLYAINEEMFDYLGSDINNELVIHELAHVVSYEEIASLAKPAYQTCESNLEEYGCPKENSYVGQFISAFWSTNDLARAAKFEQVKNRTKVAYDYYLNHDTEYVSDYAVISPTEDFAETFMFFVLGLQTEGNVVEQKIDFMNTHPELRLLRKEIQKNL